MPLQEHTYGTCSTSCQGDMALRRIKTLSGGQKSRVALAIVTYRQHFSRKERLEHETPVVASACFGFFT